MDATIRAIQRGWRVFPNGAPQQPHEWKEACKCQQRRKQGRFCDCPCHGYGGAVYIEEDK